MLNTRDTVSSGYPNTQKTVDNTTRSEVFLTTFEVFGQPMKQNLRIKRRTKIVKSFAN